MNQKIPAAVSGGQSAAGILLDILMKKCSSSELHFDGAGDGNRTHVTSLEGWGSTIELHPPEDGLDIRPLRKVER